MRKILLFLLLLSLYFVSGCNNSNSVIVTYSDFDDYYNPYPIIVPPSLVVSHIPVVVVPDPVIIPDPVVVRRHPMVVPRKPMGVPPKPVITPRKPLGIPPQPIVPPPKPILPPSHSMGKRPGMRYGHYK